MTTQRWWTPAGPGIGPDEVDLAMLDVSGTDARLDLGGTLLAAHRVGEAACRAAAETPLCDEGTLAAALVSARAQLGEPMVDAVSKCVEGGSYGALLVRDVLDDADEAAIDLYRAAVARGVAPGVAATRVGAVYGVPSAALGSYRPLATEPKAQLPALIDKADRALFDFVERLSTEESGDQKVVISKAPVAERTRTQVVTPDDPATTYYDARDEGGRFTAQATVRVAPGLLGRLRSRYGIGAQQAPDVATGRPSETAAEREQPTKIISAQELRQKQAKLKQLSSPKKRKRKAPVAVETGRATQTRAQQRRATQTRLKQKRLAPAKPSPRLIQDLALPEPAQQFLQANHPLLAKQGSPPVNYQTFDHEVGFVFDEGDAFHLNRQVASSPGRLLRIGHVVDMHGGNPEEVGDEPFEDLADQAAIDSSGADPEYKPIPLEELPDDQEEQERYLAAEAQKWGKAHADPHLERTSWMPDTRSEGYVIFTQHPDEPLPKVFEFVVRNARGRVEGTSRHMEHVLDPDQAYRLDHPEDWARNSTFDSLHGVIRARVTLTPVDDATVAAYQSYSRGEKRVRKVATLERERTAVLVRPDDPETPYYDARTSDGRFASAPRQRPGLLSIHTRAPEQQETTTPAPPAVSSATDLRARQSKLKSLSGPKRRKRRSPAQNTSTSSPTDTRASQARARQRQAEQIRLSPVGLARRELQRHLFDQIANPKTGLRIDGSHAYRVLDADTFDDLAHRNGDLNTVRDGVIRVRGEDDLAELDAQNHIGTDILPVIRQEHFDTVQAMTEPKRIGKFDTSTLQDQLAFARHAHEYAHKPDTAMVVEVPTDPNGEMSELHVHSWHPEPVVLVEFDESTDPNGPYDLIPMGQVVHHDRSRSEDDRYTSGLNHHFQVPITRYLAVDPASTADVLAHLRVSRKRSSGS